MVVHSGYKPYQCRACQLFCSQQGHITRHIRLIHWETIAFQCHDCLHCFTHHDASKYHKLFYTAFKQRQQQGKIVLAQPDGKVKLTVVGLGSNLNLLPQYQIQTTKAKANIILQELQQKLITNQGQDGATTTTTTTGMVSASGGESGMVTPSLDQNNQDDIDEERDHIVTIPNNNNNNNNASTTMSDPSEGGNRTPTSSSTTTTKNEISITFDHRVAHCPRNAKTITCPNCSAIFNVHTALLTFNSMILQQRQLFLYYQSKELMEQHSTESGLFLQGLGGE